MRHAVPHAVCGSMRQPHQYPKICADACGRMRHAAACGSRIEMDKIVRIKYL
jgi:hypothetical protein